MWTVGTSPSCSSSFCLLSRIVLKAFFLAFPITPTTVPPLPQAESHLTMISLVREQNFLHRVRKALSSLTLITNLSQKEASAMESLWVTSSRLAEQKSLFLHGLNYLCHYLKVFLLALPFPIKSQRQIPSGAYKRLFKWGLLGTWSFPVCALMTY